MQANNTLFFGRQPIVDRAQNLIGYELLYIDEQEQTVSPMDFKQSAKVITSALNLEGLDRVVGKTKAFVMVDSDFLLHDMIFSVPNQNFIFVISSKIELSDRIMTRVKLLVEKGYQLALEVGEDLISRSATVHTLLPFIEYLRIRMTHVNEIGRTKAVATLLEYGKKIMIKDVDRKEEVELFSKCEECYFQGYFFTKSEMIKPELGNSEADAIISLCNMLSLEKDTQEIIDGFNRAPSMSVQLLQYLNSSAFSFKVPVKSIEQLVVLMGRENLRRWLLLTLYAVSSDGANPNPLLHMVTARIDLMTELEKIIHPDASKEYLAQINFFALLSLIDVVLHIPMDVLLAKLSIDEAIKDALLEQKGELGELLAFTIAIEKFDILPVQEFISKHGLSPKAFEVHLVRSIENANTLLVD